MFDSRLWFALIVLYVSSVLGVALKFHRNGVRGTNLWAALVIPLFVVIMPAATFLAIYVPWIDSDSDSAISRFRKVARDKFKFSFWVMFTTIELFPLFTSFFARVISETQKERVRVPLKTAWTQTASLMMPYMMQKLSTRN